MIVRTKDGDTEKALWITERSQLPSREWRIQVWLNTEDNDLSSDIHEAVANLVKNMMEEATPTKNKVGK